MRGVVSDIFSSFQGEGLYVGERQVFVRLAGCPWRCHYCDTPRSLVRGGHKHLSVKDVLGAVAVLSSRCRHRAVSVTGGEPLMQTDFLMELFPALRKFGLKIHLETNGTEAGPLSRVVEQTDVVAMDVKLPSAVGKELWAAHEKFLRVAGSKAFVKIVLTSQTNNSEFEKAISLVQQQDPIPALVLQPVSPVDNLRKRLTGRSGPGVQVKPPVPSQLIKWWKMALRRLPDVRLIPQLHPMWGVP